MLYGQKKLEGLTNELLKKSEDAINTAMKASGQSFMDTIGTMDATTGALIGGCMEIYKTSKDLAILQARTIDNIATGMDELKKINDDLRKQNDDLQSLLQGIDRKIDKIGKRD